MAFMRVSLCRPVFVVVYKYIYYLIVHSQPFSTTSSSLPLSLSLSLSYIHTHACKRINKINSVYTDVKLVLVVCRLHCSVSIHTHTHTMERSYKRCANSNIDKLPLRIDVFDKQSVPLKCSGGGGDGPGDGSNSHRSNNSSPSASPRLLHRESFGECPLMLIDGPLADDTDRRRFAVQVFTRQMPVSRQDDENGTMSK